jgi:hypothetical protein
MAGLVLDPARPYRAWLVIILASHANPAFDLTHEKSMVVDDETAFVKSLNWVTSNLTETRDYAVVTARRLDVEGEFADG